MTRKKFSIGTFNVRGLTSNIKKELLNKDIEKLCVDVCCLQETKIKKGFDINISNNRLICFPTEKSHYDNGFWLKVSGKRIFINFGEYLKESVYYN